LETSTIFENISDSIITHINSAENGIKICVPWITDDDILNALINKAKKGIHIQIITLNDEFNRKKQAHYNMLIKNNSKVYLVDPLTNGGIPHNKFCVIDNNSVLISGSYNWSYNAKKNDENIIIHIPVEFEDLIFIDAFQEKFDQLLIKYGIENEDEGPSWDEITSLQKNDEEKLKYATDLSTLALKDIEDNKLESALELINKSIEIDRSLRYITSEPYFYWLRHNIFRKLGMYIESLDALFLFGDEINDYDNDNQELFKKSYAFLKTIIEENGIETYKIIENLNIKTRSKLYLFSRFKIEPYFFTYDELIMGNNLPF